MELSESCAGGFEIERCQKVKENGLSHEYGAGSFSYSAKKGRWHTTYVSKTLQKNMYERRKAFDGYFAAGVFYRARNG